MKAEQFDTRFAQGEDVTRDLDLTNARRPGHGQRRVNVDFPQWMIDALDLEAERVGVTRQSIVKVWITDHLDRLNRPAA